ncbi:MAG: hypothetical protein WAN61_00295 [Minisyncoccia bacterium]
MNHSEFPQHRKSILQAFPELRELLKNSKNEKIIVQKFINQFYLKHQDAITLAIQESQKEIKINHLAIKTLGESMDYHWKNNINYIAIPTILPFSPFSKNVFYFSIFDRIMGTGKRNILTVAIHEISHFVFFDLLKKIERKEKFSLPLDAKYYEKEILTTALLNEEPLRTVLKINNYLGNRDIRDIYVADQNKTIKSFVDYARDQYSKNRKSNEEFKKFLTEFTKMIYKISKELSQKRLIWNRWGSELFKNKIAFASYKKPIKLYDKMFFSLHI